MSPGSGNLPLRFEQAHYNWVNPLSTRSFADWRNQLPEWRDYVTELRDRSGAKTAFQLQTITHSWDLRAVSLILAAETLEPREGRFDFQSAGLVDMRVAPVGGTAPESVERPRPEAAQKPQRTYTELPATPDEELRVFAALHALGADVEEPIEVRLNTEKSRVLITGIGVLPDRRKEIENAISSIPKVVVALGRADGTAPSVLPPALQAADPFW
ncbi:MAG TPA: hypothetical protein VHZ07_17770 [Bryobacteraceae bacterium]|nr:hypothetical protein [Bryobacteraceae bacterium]